MSTTFRGHRSLQKETVMTIWKMSSDPNKKPLKNFRAYEKLNNKTRMKVMTTMVPTHCNKWDIIDEALIQQCSIVKTCNCMKWIDEKVKQFGNVHLAVLLFKTVYLEKLKERKQK